ncbi:MAG: sigma 54-interacting transcriptional regulator [Tissierellia bacterium]|nr:sigma 54-interacting transcriptional regulator [Tissierellia bacterium]
MFVDHREKLCKFKKIEMQSDFGFNNMTFEILNTLDDGVFITNADGYILFVNKAYERISDLDRDDLLGYNLEYLINLHVFKDGACIRALINGEKCSIIERFHDRECLVTGNLLKDDAGKVVLVIATIRYLDELQRLKNELEISKVLTLTYYEELQKLKKNEAAQQNVIYGNSDNMKAIFQQIQAIREVDATILITGETGVGKEIIAQEIHKESKRCKGPYIKLNCSSIPENLIESELFGYAKGAFTGANQQGKLGLFEMANGGTLLLDEIGELSLSAQSKLLRVLQERKVLPVGGTSYRDIDVRLVAATNRDLKKMVEKGSFRHDLYYRLNVVPIRVPPLRERKEDIPLFINFFLEQLNRKYNKNKILSDRIERHLENYCYPGNVRELRNIIERIVLMPDDASLEGLLFELTLETIDDDGNNGYCLQDAVDRLEAHFIKNALTNCKNTREAAKKIGISQATLVRKVKKHKLNQYYK